MTPPIGFTEHPEGPTRPRGFFLPSFHRLRPAGDIGEIERPQNREHAPQGFLGRCGEFPTLGQSGFHIACRDASSQLLGTGPTAFEPATESHQRRAVGCRAKALLPSMASGDGDGKSWFQSWALFPRRRGNRASAQLGLQKFTAQAQRSNRPQNTAKNSNEIFGLSAIFFTTNCSTRNDIDLHNQTTRMGARAAC